MVHGIDAWPVCGKHGTSSTEGNIRSKTPNDLAHGPVREYYMDPSMESMYAKYAKYALMPPNGGRRRVSVYE